MRGRTQSAAASLFGDGKRRIASRRRDRLGEYPTPSQIAFRIGVAMLVALCVALAANLFVATMGP